MMPKMRPVGQCLNCKKLLISDVYQLCVPCAAALVSSAAPQRSDELDQFYLETGGEGGGA